MNNIIWTKQELKNIKQIILRKTNLKINEDNQLNIVANKDIMSDDFNLTTNIYLNFEKEIIDLFYFQDRRKIKEILTNASLVDADIDNRLHHGFIINLSKINSDNCDEIFLIFKDLIGHYEHVINMVAEKMISNVDSEEMIREKIEHLKNATNTTIEEKLVINHLRKTFLFANGVCDEEIFQPLINKLNSLIRTRIIYKYNLILAKEIKKKNKLAKKDYNEIKKEHHEKYLKIRRSKNRAYGMRIYD